MSKINFTKEIRKLTLKEIGVISMIIQLNEFGTQITYSKLSSGTLSGKSSVSNTCRKLVKKGFLEIEKFKDEKGRFTKSNYKVLKGLYSVDKMNA